MNLSDLKKMSAAQLLDIAAEKNKILSSPFSRLMQKAVKTFMAKEYLKFCPMASVF